MLNIQFLDIEIVEQMSVGRTGSRGNTSGKGVFALFFACNRIVSFLLMIQGHGHQVNEGRNRFFVKNYHTGDKVSYFSPSLLFPSIY